MRRPHVYERSAPRSPRSPYHEPMGRMASAARDIACSLPGLLFKAETAGLSKLAGLIQRALEEAELAVRRGDPLPSQDAAGVEYHPSLGSETEGLMRVRDISKVLTPTKA